MKKKFQNIFSKNYKHGFWTSIKRNKFPFGLNKKNILLLSKKKEESINLTNYRLKSYKKWNLMKFPVWTYLKFPKLNFKNLLIYSTPFKKPKNTSSDLLLTFKKCGVPLINNEKTTSIAIDAVFDSISIGTTFKNTLAKSGIIFCSLSEAIITYPKLINKYLGSVVPYGDNFFSALNSAIFSDGSFCYIPKNIHCPLELSTYFRINDRESGQFERTLIIAESNSQVNYLEGCTAVQYNKNQLHAAVVEIIVNTNAKIKYATVQNWYSGDQSGLGGIFNLVTKRGLCLGHSSSLLWTQVETGSAITWKYPSTLLIGNFSTSEFYSISITNNYQQTDTGTKMIHLGKYTKSKIIAKGISTGHSKNIYRGLVKFASNAHSSKNFSECDSLLIGSNSRSITFPYIEIANSTSIVEHEAKISQISDEQMFYLQQRGILLELALTLLISGFCKDVLNILPIEFAIEANVLLQLKLENSITE
jgi:Fe-S cluster assembly protein SufB